MIMQENTANNEFVKKEIGYIADDVRGKSNPPDIVALYANGNPFVNKAANTKDVFSQSIDRQKAKIQTSGFGNIKDSEIYSNLSDGSRVAKFEAIPNNVTDYKGLEEHYAERQGTGEKWANGATKFLGKTLTGVVGGTVGSINGIVEGVQTLSFKSTYDNGFNDWLDDLNTKMDYKLPNYYNQQEKDANILQSFGSANFWANDVLGGLSFTVGALVSEGIWAAATGGTSLGTTLARQGARAGRLFGRTAETAQAMNTATSWIKTGALRGFANKNLSAELATKFGKVGELANTARFTYTSAGYESGFEARHYMKEASETYFSDFEGKNGRPPTHEEAVNFNLDLNKSANTLFAFNMGVVGSSNLAIFGKMMNIKSPINMPTAWANQKFLGIGTRKAADGTLEAVTATRAQNILAKAFTVAKTPLTEGLWEEGMQSAGSNTAKIWLGHTYDPNVTKETLDLGLDFAQGIGETYGGKEGWKEIGIGMIIGLLSGTGVGIARGKGVFGELDDARKKVDDEVLVRNDYTVEKLLERIHTANRVSAFGKQAEEFEEKGDITGAELSRSSAMIANITASYNFDYMEDALEEVKQGIDTMDDEVLMKQYGLTSKDEVQGLKDTMFSDYSRLATEYKKQRDFVGYMINENDKAFSSRASAIKMQEAVAYELTLGSKAHEFNGELLEDIQKTLSGFYNSKGEAIVNALKAQDILWSASKEVRREFTNTQKELKRAKAEKVTLEKERLSIEGKPTSKVEGVNSLDGLNSVMAKIEANEARLQDLNTQLEGVLSAAALQNPYTKENSTFITADELSQVDVNLKDVTELVQNVKKMNAREGYRLEGLLKEYQKSKAAFTRYADLSRQLSDPTLGLRGKRNIISELKRDKEPNEITREFVESLDESMKNTSAERLLEAQEVEVKRAVAKMEMPKQEKKKVSTIEDILEDNPYLFEYVGDKENAVKPTVEEIQEYKGLLTRIRRSKKIDNKKATQNKSDYYARKGIKIPLSKSEMARFQELNQKVSDWRVYGAAMNDEGISMANLIEQELSRTKEIKGVEVLEELGIDDYVLVVTPTEAVPNSTEQRKADIIQTYDTVKVQVREGLYMFSHLNFTSLLKGNYKVTMKTAKTVDENGYVVEYNKPVVATNEDIANNQHKSQTAFVIETPSGNVNVTVTSHGRLAIPIAEFNKSKADLGLDIFKQVATRTTYADAYEDDGNGNFTPKDSDFKLKQELGAQEVIFYEPDEVTKLQKGDNTFFKVNTKDSYNAGLIEQFENDEITYDQVVARVKVYNTAANGKILGDLKSDEDITEGSDNFLNIRRMAADVLLNKNPSQDMITIPYVAKVKHVLIGTPSLTMVKTDDGMIPQTITLTDGAVEQIVDYGYMENGRLVLKGDTKNVRTDFVAKLSKKNNIPVIIFKKGEYLVAFPVSLTKRAVDNSQEIIKVLRSKINKAEKATVVNTILRENGIEGNFEYTTEDKQNLYEEDGSISEVLQGHIDALSQAQEAAKVEDWMDDSHTKDMLVEEINITVDLEGRVLKSPKVIIDFDGAEMNQSDTPWYDVYMSTGQVSDEKIHEFANMAVEAGLNSNPIDIYRKKMVELQDKYKELKDRIAPLESEVKQIRPVKNKPLSAEQQSRKDEILDNIEPIQDELRKITQEITNLNVNTTQVSLDKVFTRQEADVYRGESARIKEAINDIVRLDRLKQKAAQDAKNEPC